MTGGSVAALAGATVCVVAAVWPTVCQERGLRRARALFGDAGVAGGPAPGGVLGACARERWRRRARGWARRVPGVWLCLPVAVVLALLGKSVLPLIGGVLAVPLVGRRLRAGRRRKAEDLRASQVLALCGAMAGELRAGLQPATALAAAAGSTGGLGGAEAAVLAAARFGGDVPGALRRAGSAPGADGLVGLAACWRVAVDGGAGLGAGLDRLEAVLRAERDQREGLRAHLAGAWSTVVVLAFLPVVGLAMGWAMGADPLRVLFHTPAGLGCLVVGGLLEGAGLWWAARIVRTGETV
ncbi:type II secretion system F family protein [Streptomyces sp. NRRL F-5135]|uniref:type II secretion system F family protein n=1 Tax=Streptomyces sp. NRRL F-5135 TaxID=1463858 RepID=UPI00099CF799